MQARPDIFPDPPTTPPPPFVPPPLPPRPPRRGPGCFAGVLGGCLASVVLLVGGFVLVGVLMALGFSRAVEKLDEVKALGVHTASSYEYLTGSDACSRQVLRLELNGVITGEAPSRWYLPPDCDAAVRAEIEDAIEDETIDGLLLVVSSPGGAVTASDELHHAITRFKAARDDRKVLIFGRDLLASGAYYLAVAGDWICLQPTTLVGSIGVIMPGLNFAPLADKLGIADNSIASGPNKDLGNPVKPVNPAHNALLQTMVNGLHTRFISLVAAGRHLPEETIRPLADGSVYLPQDALNLRLIDEIAYEDALPARLAALFACSEEEIALFQPTPKRQTLRAFLSELPTSLGRGIAAPLLEQRPLQPALLYR